MSPICFCYFLFLFCIFNFRSTDLYVHSAVRKAVPTYLYSPVPTPNSVVPTPVPIQWSKRPASRKQQGITLLVVVVLMDITDRCLRNYFCVGTLTTLPPPISEHHQCIAKCHIACILAHLLHNNSSKSDWATVQHICYTTTPQNQIGRLFR